MWKRSFVVAALVGLLMSLPSAGLRGDEAATLAELIDEHIQTRLKKDGLTRAAQTEDPEFLRRVYLDLHGVVPSLKQTIEFLDSDAPDKRAKLVEELLASPRFGQHFGDVWRGRLMPSLASDAQKQGQRFADMLATRFNNNDRWDQIAFDLLTATGKIEENAAVTYLIEGRHPLSVTDLTDLSSRYFLGIRLNCTQCHDHPFVEWKRQDYWGMAAFFAQIQTPRRPKAVYVAGVRDDPKMTLETLKDADAIEGLQLAQPTFLGGEKFQADGDKPYRVALAQWMTSSKNPYFARAMVNRMWWHFFGRGIVNPVDDMHAGNLASHPELLDLLSHRFAESGFDFKLLCRAIAGSRTYQQTSRTTEEAESADELFARMSIKVLTPGQLYDSLETVLGTPAKGSGTDNRSRARYEFCQFFAAGGDPDPIRYERGIPHLLRLMNSSQFAGPNITALVSRAQGNNRSPDVVVEELFLTILSRRPTTDERRLIQDQWDGAKASPETTYRELAWALVMSSEFALNH